MWIRSQNKETLANADKLYIGKNNNKYTINFDTYIDGWYILGTYKSKERALEVLDEIQRLIEDLKYMEYAIDKNKFCGYRSNVYQMPME